VPAVVAVNVDVHVADAVAPLNVQVVKLPDTPISDRVTLPVGVRNVPAVVVSVTVMLQVEPWLVDTGLVQLTLVLAALRFTVTLVVPLLDA
jgi:hypothetical protein